jgi:putative hydrolase of the HAD superfamily
MSPTTIRAVTFDLWDTILVNDSDESRRKAQGLLPKKIERRSLVHRFLTRHGSIDPDAVKRAYDHIDREFN